MTYDIKQGTAQEIENFLNNALVLGPLQAGSVLVGGKTLLITAPSATTVTFPGAVGANVSLAALKTTLEAVSGLRARLYQLPDQRSHAIAIFFESGMTVSKDGTANALLGLSTTVDTEKAAPVSASGIRQLTPGLTPDRYALLLESE